MMRKRKYIDRISPLKKVIIVTGLLLSLFVGGVAIRVVVNTLRNYDHPYLFGFTFGTLGLAGGWYAAKKLRSEIAVTAQMHQYYYQIKWMIYAPFIGLTMLLAKQINTQFLTNKKCRDYIVTKKIYIESSIRQRERFAVLINVNGKIYKFFTHYDDWQSVSVGQKRKVCLHQSEIGFGFVTYMMNDAHK